MAIDPLEDLLGGSLSSDLIRVLQQRHPKKAALLAGAQAVWPAFSWARAKYRDTHSYTIAVSSAMDEHAYFMASAWVLSMLPEAERRFISVQSLPAGHDGDEGSEFPQDLIQVRNSHPALTARGKAERKDRPGLQMIHESRSAAEFRLGSHLVRAVVADSGGTGDDDGKVLFPELRLSVTSMAARDAVLNALAALLREEARKGPRQPSAYVFGQWGGWDRLNFLPPRDIESLILPQGQLERILTDITEFLGSEQEYVRRGMPWHRGYLFEGPAGTGKTSAARVLASHFGMDLRYLPLGDVNRDTELIRRIADIPPRSVLVLEDADVFHAATRRDDDSSSATLAGLLNALDGIATPHGLITILTTNSVGALEPALLRPGRVDMKEHFGQCDADQAARIISWWFGEPLWDIQQAQDTAPVMPGLMPADLIGICRDSGTPAEALARAFTAAMGEAGFSAN